MTFLTEQRNRGSSSSLGAAKAQGLFKPLQRTVPDLRLGSDFSQWDWSQKSASSSLKQRRNRLQLLGQALGFGSSFKSLAGRLLKQSCCSCFMFGDICSSTVTALFSCAYFLSSSTCREKNSLLAFFIEMIFRQH